MNLKVVMKFKKGKEEVEISGIFGGSAKYRVIF